MIGLALGRGLMVASILILGFFGIIPFVVDKYVKIKHKKKELAISFGNCFVAGVFLSIGFVHLLSESSTVDELVDIPIPIAFVMSPVGFLFIFVIEKIANCFEGHEHGHSHGGGSKKKKKNKKNKHINSGVDKLESTSLLGAKESPGYILLETSYTNESANNANNYQISIDNDIISRGYGTFTNDTAVVIDNNNNEDNNIKQSTQNKLIDTIDLIKLNNQQQQQQLNNNHNNNGQDNEDHHDHHHKEEEKEKEVLKGPLPILLVFILSIHSILSGFTLGIETNIDLLVPLFIGIASHKWLEAMSLGVSLLRSASDFKKTIKYLFLYSITEPIGIIVGMTMSSVNEVAKLIILAFSSGTFIYIALIDILLVEFSDQIKQTRLLKSLKLLFCIVGFVGMSALTLAFDNDDEDSVHH